MTSFALRFAPCAVMQKELGGSDAPSAPDWMTTDTLQSGGVAYSRYHQALHTMYLCVYQTCSWLKSHPLSLAPSDVDNDWKAVMSHESCNIDLIAAQA